ncbi:insulinase family protein [Synechococcus sp. M16CYN]
MPDAPLTCLDFWCQAGSTSEHSGEEGMAHFLEHMVFKGSRRLAAGAFDEAIETLGGSSNAATGFDDVHFHVLVPPERAPEALDLLLELVLQPTFDSHGFLTERDVVLEEIAQYVDQPTEQVLQSVLSLGCGNHAYGRPILGEINSLKAMDPFAMRQFHQRRYCGPNCALAVAGPAPERLKSVIASSALADLSTGPIATTPVEPVTVRAGRHTKQVDRLRSARVLMLWSIAPAQDQDTVMGADLATTLLGEGRRSRLVRRLREELRLVENVSMDLTALEGGSLITLELICPENALPTVETEVSLILNQASNEAVSEQELRRGLQLVSNSLRYSLESVSHVASLCASHVLWHRNQDLLAPLKHLGQWSSCRLCSELFPALLPEKACILVAYPGTN